LSVGVAQVLAHRPAEEALEDRETPVRRRRRAAGVTRQRVAAQVVFARIEQGRTPSFAVEPGGE
jgi:hypothetical protein